MLVVQFLGQSSSQSYFLYQSCVYIFRWSNYAQLPSPSHFCCVLNSHVILCYSFRSLWSTMKCLFFSTLIFLLYSSKPSCCYLLLIILKQNIYFVAQLMVESVLADYKSWLILSIEDGLQQCCLMILLVCYSGDYSNLFKFWHL